MALGHPSHFQSGPRPGQAPEQSFPPECQRGRLWLKFLSVFWNTSGPMWASRLRKWPPGPREIGFPPLPAGWSHLPSTQEQGVGL